MECARLYRALSGVRRTAPVCHRAGTAYADFDAHLEPVHARRRPGDAVADLAQRHWDSRGDAGGLTRRHWRISRNGGAARRADLRHLGLEHPSRRICAGERRLPTGHERAAATQRRSPALMPTTRFIETARKPWATTGERMTWYELAEAVQTRLARPATVSHVRGGSLAREPDPWTTTFALSLALVALGHALQLSNGFYQPRALLWLSAAFVVPVLGVALPPIPQLERLGAKAVLFVLGA